MRLLLMATAGLLSSCAVVAQDPPLQFGITDTRSSPFACAIFDDAELSPGQALLFVAFDPPRWVHGRIVQKRTSVCRSDSLLEGIPYDVQLDEAEGMSGQLGVAIVGPGLTPASARGQLQFTRASGGEVVTVRSCTSNEGVHFFALEGQWEIWHEYYYVPYSIEPTCLDSDFSTEAR
jgi:hypothetical protein